MVTVLQLHGNMLSRFCFLLFYVTLISMRCFFESIKDNTRETVSEKVKKRSSTKFFLIPSLLGRVIRLCKSLKSQTRKFSNEKVNYDKYYDDCETEINSD